MGDNDFPTVITNGGQFLSGYMQRKGLYQQSGTDIPEGSMRYVVEQQLGGPLKGEVEIAGQIRSLPGATPANAIIKAPHIDSPFMDKLFERGMQRPSLPAKPKSGPQLPGFV